MSITQTNWARLKKSGLCGTALAEGVKPIGPPRYCFLTDQLPEPGAIESWRYLTPPIPPDP